MTGINFPEAVNLMLLITKQVFAGVSSRYFWCATNFQHLISHKIFEEHRKWCFALSGRELCAI